MKSAKSRESSGVQCHTIGVLMRLDHRENIDVI